MFFIHYIYTLFSKCHSNYIELYVMFYEYDDDNDDDNDDNRDDSGDKDKNDVNYIISIFHA